MFGLFRKKAGPVVTDRIYLNHAAKWKACRELTNDPTNAFIAWFAETAEIFQRETGSNEIWLAREARQLSHFNRPVYFLEHYPLREPEERLFRDLKLENAIVLSSLDEPFFHFFNGEKLEVLAQKLGLKEDECLNHPFITTSIRNAQDKIASITADRSANSPSQWFEGLRS